MTARRTLSLTIATLAAVSIATPASAAGWGILDGQSAEAPQAIYTTGEEQPGTLLYCRSDGYLKAFMSLEANDMLGQFALNAPYTRSEEAKMTFGEKPAVDTEVRLIPAMKMIESRSHKIGAKLFNAAIRGEKITLDVDTAGQVQTTLPAPDDTFKAFARTCNEKRASTT